MPHALVVEDYQNLAELLARALNKAGWQTTVTLSAAEALAAAESVSFDLVLSDIGLPGMSGYELIRRLRRLPPYRCTPAIALTGFACYDDRARSLAAGFDEHVTKPVNPQTLLNKIKWVCQNKRQNKN
ncbi:MAG: response regulator [Pyrinomonadaceae bacterium MAG19_C2-C3]|nr:response regulator [Pyrinomonadaceae bacterium MAG19_C2-C3]